MAAPGDASRGGLRSSGGRAGASGDGLRSSGCPPEPPRGGLRSSGGWVRFFLQLGIGFGALLLVSIIIRTLDLDLRVARAFYRPGIVPVWIGIHRQPWDAIYSYGPWPANITGGTACMLFLASFVRKELRRHRRACAILALVLAIGPGLIVNGILKPTWERARPRDCIEFGGTETFVPVGAVGQPGAGQSFPSGHAASGFYFLTLAILWWGRRPRAAALGLAGGLVAGGLLSMQRMLVGAHFLSDCVWSGGIVILTALAVDRLCSVRLE